MTLEEGRAKFANEYLSKINKIVEELNKEDKTVFDQIEEKDEIVMLNQELEN